MNPNIFNIMPIILFTIQLAFYILSDTSYTLNCTTNKKWDYQLPIIRIGLIWICTDWLVLFVLCVQ